ncbi:MAG TPA: hypothetical protein ENG83_12350 [Nitrospirae bacterium]|nr:hypothetical protein [Nitrospirota bacterium]HDZ00456.1 hypothetical protein [Nitrospirota bacterium]
MRNILETKEEKKTLNNSKCFNFDHDALRSLPQGSSLEIITEGKCVQVMHIGPYSTEPETINLLMAFIAENGLSVNGLHHEIYISDPRKTEPAKMKTLIRYPVK